MLMTSPEQDSGEFDPGLAGPGLDPITRQAQAVMKVLGDLIPWDAYSLSAWDAASGTRDHVKLAGEGYSPDLQDVVHRNFNDENPWFRLLHHNPHQALRWVDMERDFDWDITRIRVAEEHLIPAGFREGAGLYLRAPDGRYTGTLSLNWTKQKDATDEARYILEKFSPLLAQACDVLSGAYQRLESLEDCDFVVVVSERGAITEIPGFEAGPHLSEGGRLRSMIDRHSNHRLWRRYLWVDELRQCCRVEVIPIERNARLITLTVIDWPFGLTLRETDVLTFLTLGYTNPKIADRLRISPRTVSTHVEHVLTKLRCQTRTQLAATAVRAHLERLEILGEVL